MWGGGLRIPLHSVIFVNNNDSYYSFIPKHNQYRSIKDELDVTQHRIMTNYLRNKPHRSSPADALAVAITLTVTLALSSLPATAAQDSAASAASSAASRRNIIETVEVIGRREQTSFATETFSATRFKSDILDIGQSISVVTKEMIQDQGLMRLNDVTPYVAGANEFSVYNDITIRGFRNADDRRVNGMRVYNDFWTQDTIAYVERVEIIKGPAAITFGDASPGGVVNTVTKKPLDEFRHSVFARVGSFSERYLALDTTGPVSENLFYRLNVAREDSDSFRKQTFNENTVVAPSVTYIPFENTRINLDYVYLDNGGVLDRGQPNILGSQTLDEIPIETSLSQPGDELSTQSHNLTVSLDQRINDNWSFALAHNQVDYDQKLVEHRASGYITNNPGESRINLRYNDRDGEADASSTFAYATGVFKTGALDHKIVFGVDVAERENFQIQTGQRNVGVVDLLDPVSINQPRNTGSYDLALGNPWGGRLESTGIYVQDQITLGDWQLMIGLREDDYEITTQNGEKSSDSQISPRVSALYRLSGSSSVYASWVTGFQPPSPSENSALFGGPFDPSDSELFEVGYKAMLLDGSALFVASIYRITKNNAIVNANNPQNPDLNVQRGQEQAEGLELEFSGQVSSKLLLIANYAYNSAEITEDANPDLVGKRKEGAPRHNATVWGRYDFTDRIGLGTGLEYVIERHTFQEGLFLPSYTLWNASVFYQPTDKLRFAVQARNLTDETHWTGGYYSARLYPGDPRRFTLNVQYEF